ncbi:2-dehydro-3-deoxygalactonokinase [Erythrobacter sp. F6033]|uniref:2-dehydro-3-deoxygalactonokinase n=1 Tax=Erythrobacter sp. F6033 TaxID=2926401 RepID=UPI001FF2A506|nr:2-dehydro-3-deoxygalactonokinase [Erythrobacter sp. F6033]MCK0129283.1 2-dehydro-3-deoxygalactonokinase [Erythrobacter sp. F6033]
MYSKPYIGVDWGTSRMRAMLIEEGVSAPDRDHIAYGDGIAKLNRPIADVLLETIEPWTSKFGKLNIVMAGMVGSNIGWRETGYVDCPATLHELSAHAEGFNQCGHKMAILPGLRCENPMGQADLMRGEELQMLGWLASNPDASQEDRLFCLPGTHTKWCRMSGSRLESFNTALTGELFALLKEHSILVAKSDVIFAKPFDQDSFLAGVELMLNHPDALLHSLFSTRTRTLTNPDGAGDGPSYMSGLLLGSCVQNALSLYGVPEQGVELIGDPSLCSKYALAIERLGHKSTTLDGIDAIHAGFLAL